MAGRPSDLEQQQAAARRAVDEGIARADASTDPAEALAVLHRHKQRQDDTELRKPLRAHSCSHCQRLVLDNSMPEQRSIMPGFIQPKLIDFDVTLAQIVLGAQDNCPLCQQIVSQLDRAHESFENDKDENLFCATFGHSGQGGEYDLQCVSPFNIISRERGWTKWANRTSNENWTYYCIADEKDPASDFTTSRPIVIDPASEESFSLMRSWLAECRYGHDSCQAFTTKFRPLRLIEISGTIEDPRLRLVEADEPLVEYTTLSYCWGGAQPMETTKVNLESRLGALKISSLPKTIQDAVLVTQRLKIGFIWIDSLCILQDSAEDKLRQIAFMPQIYQNATLTISTTRAVHANEGLLGARKPTDHPEQVFKLPYRILSGGMGNLTLFRPAAEHFDDLLSTRGWTLQEFALSPRILDFSSAQTRWICQTYHVDGWQMYGGLGKEYNLRTRVMNMMHCSHEGKGSVFTFGEGCSFWEDLIVQYTSRLLSDPSDRPLAMAGLAETCCGHIGWKEQYLAGMWRSMFPWALFWSMPIRQRGRIPRPAKYQGPSWSWTAINGAVHFGLCQKLNDGLIQMNVLDCSVELEDQRAPFGAVKSGALVIEGKTLDAQWLGKSDKLDLDVLKLLHAENGGEGFVALSMCPDAQEDDWEDEAVKSIDVVLLEVGYEPQQHLSHHGALGLVLRKLGDGFYSRLGWFETRRGPRLKEDEVPAEDVNALWEQYRDIFENAEKEIVVIV